MSKLSYWGQKGHILRANMCCLKQPLPVARSSFILRNSWVCQAWSICPTFPALWHGTGQETMYERIVLNYCKRTGADSLFENWEKKISLKYNFQEGTGQNYSFLWNMMHLLQGTLRRFYNQLRAIAEWD